MDTDWRTTIDPVQTIFFSFWKSSRWMLVLSASIVFLAAITSVAAPYIFSRLIDQLQLNFQLEQLLLGFALYALLLGLAAAFQNMVQYMSLIISQNLGFIASTSFFEKLVKKTAAFFIDHNPAEIRSAQTRGEQALSMVIQLVTLVFIPGVTQVLFTLFVLGAVINKEIVAIVVVYGLSFIAFTFFANKWTRSFLDTAINASQENAKFVGNSINSMEALRQFGSDDWIIRRFGNKAAEERDAWGLFARYRIAFTAAYGLALSVQFIITFWLLIPRYQTGELSLGDVVLFNMLLLQLNQPFEMFGSAIDDMVRAWSRFRPFARMWAAPEETEPEEPLSLTLESGHIRFAEVGFSYGNGRGVSGIGFSARRGAITFVTGETGSGKSTLFKLALKSLEPERGEILVDGINLSTISRADWFAHIGIVPQDVMLLNESLTSNIVLGRAYDEQQLHRAAEQAAILEFIRALPEGFDTNVGERGLRLSGGERQRIAIARALYARPKILFPDKTRAALDEATEAQIMSGLRQLADSITIIAITHRKSVISTADTVINLDEASHEN